MFDGVVWTEERMVRKRGAAHGVGIYTAIFAVLGCVCYGGMILKGAVWNVDGLMQHYPFMKVIGDWIRNALSGNFRAFDFSIGFGADVLTSLNYYGLGDPLLMIIALAAGANEWGYAVLIAVRIWLAGLACMRLSRELGFSEKQRVIAGVLYALSTGMFAGAASRQILFLNAYIHFPVMLTGVECAIKNKRAGWLTLGAWLAALSGFYMLYCESALLLVCAIVRYCTQKERKTSFTRAAGRAIGQYLIGIALAAVVFVPVTFGFLDGQRLSGAFDLSHTRVLYALKSYAQMPAALLTTHGTGAAQPIVIVGLIGLIPMLKKDKSARAFAIIALLAALTPLTGWALNGFSYETTRWSFALSLLAALLGARAIDCAETLEKRALNRICAAIAAYPIALLIASVSGVNKIVAAALVGGAMIVFAGWVLKKRGDWRAAIALLGLAFTVYAGGGMRRLIPAAMLVLIAGAWIALRARGRIGKILIAGVCAAQLILNGWDVWQDRAGEMMRWGESRTAYEESAFASLSAFPRTDASLSAVAPLLNAPTWSRAAGTSVYNSTISGRVFRFMQDLGNSGLIQVNSICGLDGRAALETVWAVGRYVGDGAPYGFEAVDGIYENRYTLPIGYAYTDSISNEEYAALSPLEKQWALLQCAVLKQSSGGTAKQSLADVPIEKVEWENIEREGEILNVGEDACIRLTFSAPADCELYLSIDSLEYHGSEIALGNYVSFQSGAGQRMIHLMPENFELTIRDRGTFYICLGYDSEVRTTAEIRFARAGEYQMGALKLIAQPMADYEEMVSALQARGLRDVEIGNDRVSGKISLDAAGTVVCAIPYSSGWTATVDGAKVETTCSAGTMLAVPVSEGEHEIVVAYETPGLRLGGAITLIAAVAAGILLRRSK